MATDDKEEADKVRIRKEKEIKDDNVFVCIYPLKIKL
jgi:hypothetical protein